MLLLHVLASCTIPVEYGPIHFDGSSLFLECSSHDDLRRVAAEDGCMIGVDLRLLQKGEVVYLAIGTLDDNGSPTDEAGKEWHYFARFLLEYGKYEPKGMLRNWLTGLQYEEAEIQVKLRRPWPDWHPFSLVRVSRYEITNAMKTQ
jgi:hypothetical protein